MRLLLAAGSNGAGQLGVAHRDDLSSFTPCTRADARPSDRILDLASGANHSLLLSASHPQLWATGSNEHHQLGPQLSARTTLDVWTPLDLDTLLRSAGLDGGGVVYTPIGIACSWTTSFIAFSRTSSGVGMSDIVLSCGTNDFGELGCGITDGPVSTGVKGKVQIVRLPGWEDTVVSEREVMSIQQLSASQRHVVCLVQILTDNGAQQRVYGWGASRHGQLSPSSSHDISTTASSSNPHPKSARKPSSTKYPPNQPTPTRINIPTTPGTTITQISTGAAHTIVRLSSGHLLALGNNAKRQLDVPCAPVRGVGCTWNGTVGWAEGGEVWSTGSNTHGQLGRAADAGAVRFPGLQQGAGVRKLVCGSEHVLVVVDVDVDVGEGGARETRLYRWGWNEHGNLGLGTREDQWRPVWKPVIAPGFAGHGRVVNAWAGCGTSWVLVEVGGD